MRWSGVILLLFIVYHLLHFTFGTVHPSFVEGDVYHNLVAGFQNVRVSLFYILAMLALGPPPLPRRLEHVPDARRLAPALHPAGAHVAAWIFAAIVVVGNISFPLAVLAGLVK